MSFTRLGLSVLLVALVALIVGGDSIHADRTSDVDESNRVVKPNYQQAAQYSSRYLRQFMYDTSVRPNWIGETDQFWYSYRTSDGIRFVRVDPARPSKEPLFDQTKLAAQLSAMIRKPIDPRLLQLSRVQVDDEGRKMTFTTENAQFSYDLVDEKLEKSDRPNTQRIRSMDEFSSREEYIEYRRRLFEEQRRNGGDGERTDDSTSQDSSRSRTNHRVFSPDRKSYVFAKGHNLYYVEIPEETETAKQESEDQEKDPADEQAEEVEKTQQGDDSKVGQTGEEKSDEEQGDKDGDQQDDQQQGDSDKEDQRGDDREKQDEDKQEREQDTEDGDKQEDDQQQDDKDDEKDDNGEQGNEDESGEEAEGDEELPIPEVDPKLDDAAIQLTTDGEQNYSFAGRTRGSSRSRSGSDSNATISEDQKTRPSVSWSKDSRSFYVSRRDSRDVKELWVINSLADPRPTLEKYSYPMPGEENIRKSELYYWNVDNEDLRKVDSKWTDEGHSNTHFGKSGDELRFLRRDRLLRNVELCSLDVCTGQVEVLMEEGFENAHIAPQSIRYLEETDEMIWWSERSGWGHFYLYDRDGNLKNAITSGQFRASRIVDVDEANRTLYFRANGREEGENIYLEHLYCVQLDGSGLRLLDPGDANHSSTLSPSKQYLVDNCSRVDMAPISVLRNRDGEVILELEEADLSRLAEVGWRMPETFTVKASDGVTDLYGNMWKPFDFDPNKRYPIIAHVYPGPQTEGTRHTFSATAGEQQLAQLGFIVIQVGHRGGTPQRSKAYGSYGYFNLRDYGLADKKAAIEQLAQKFAYIDIERVGIYGHSGGGFMTAAALLREPYNDFFKVGVSTAGNHDNNIYNNSWSERYHGLKEVEVKEEEQQQSRSRTGRQRRGGEGEVNRRRDEQQNEGDDGAFHVEASDYFYQYEMLHGDADLSWDDSLDQLWWEDPELAVWLQEQDQQQDQQQDDGDKDDSQGDRGDGTENKDEQTDKGQTQDEQTDDQQKQEGDKEEDKDEQQDGDDDKELVEEEKDEQQDTDDGDQDQEREEDESEEEKKTKFEIEVPTNAELAKNLKGHLFLIHGELDNNVHPANTLRLVDALIKADKRFDMLYLPATRHGFGSYQPYVTQRMYEYFAEHLLDDYQSGADINEKEK